jgi:hypothetical protein
MSATDKIIDKLMEERELAESQGMRQNEADSMILLAALLEDVKRNPEHYARKN